MRENINLCDLKWNYPFLPKGSNISYCIENKNTLIAVKIYNSNSCDIYRTQLDIIDIQKGKKINEIARNNRYT